MKTVHRAILGTSLLAIASGAVQAHIYNIVTGMWHNPAGYQFNSTTWALTSAGQASPAMTYGPYATNIPGGLHLVYTRLTMLPASGQTLWAIWDVANQQNGTILATRAPTTTVTRTPFMAAYINTPSVSNLEVRTFHQGNGTLRQNNVHILTEQQNLEQELWPAAAPYNYHIVGYKVPETEMYEAKPANGSGYLTYGPYINLTKGTGNYVVGFSLSIDNTYPLTEKVATLDVVYRLPGSQTVVSAGSVDVYRRDFDFSQTMTVFPFEFNNNNAGNWGWEFRVRYHGTGTLRHGRTGVYKVF